MHHRFQPSTFRCSVVDSPVDEERKLSYQHKLQDENIDRHCDNLRQELHTDITLY